MFSFATAISLNSCKTIWRMIKTGARTVGPQRWKERPRLYKAVIWISYGIVVLGMGWLGYGGNEWFRSRGSAGTERAIRTKTGG
jgi:hypothetical protein